MQPGTFGRGIKCVTVNEPFFAGHYPDHSIMPGVMIIEAMAQLVAVVYVAEALQAADPEQDGDAGTGFEGAAGSNVGYLGAVRQMKFSRLVVPGDQLLLQARMGSRLGNLRSVEVSASVGSELAAAGTLTVSER